MNYDQNTIDNALIMLMNKIEEPEMMANNPHEVRAFLQLKLLPKESEVFCCMFLTNQNELIEFKEMFQGTINACSVHPREVIKQALKLNAAAVILAHNHPSGLAVPSMSDIDITSTLKKALNYVDVRLLDHFIVAGHEVVSMAEKGQI